MMYRPARERLYSEEEYIAYIKMHVFMTRACQGVPYQYKLNKSAFNMNTIYQFCDAFTDVSATHTKLDPHCSIQKVAPKLQK